MSINQQELIGSLYIWICDNVTYFDSLGVEYISKVIKKFVRNKNTIANICRIQEYDSLICGYICIGVIDVMVKGKDLLDYTKLFSPNIFKIKIK